MAGANEQGRRGPAQNVQRSIGAVSRVRHGPSREFMTNVSGAARSRRLLAAPRNGLIARTAKDLAAAGIGPWDATYGSAGPLLWAEGWRHDGLEAAPGPAGGGRTRGRRRSHL